MSNSWEESNLYISLFQEMLQNFKNPLQLSYFSSDFDKNFTIIKLFSIYSIQLANVPDLPFNDTLKYYYSNYNQTKLPKWPF